MQEMRLLFTIGHSSRSQQELLDQLQETEIDLLWDVRTLPRSRRYPWFGRSSLEAALSGRGIGYRHVPELGGLRGTAEQSPHLGLEPARRAYADYMQTAPFQSALRRLEEAAGRRRVALLCAEADPRRCHRHLICDALVLGSWRVEHLVADGREEHVLHPRAEPGPSGSPVYPGEPERQLGLFSSS